MVDFGARPNVISISLITHAIGQSFSSWFSFLIYKWRLPKVLVQSGIWSGGCLAKPKTVSSSKCLPLAAVVVELLIEHHNFISDKSLLSVNE